MGLWGDLPGGGDVLYLYLGGGYMCVHTCENLSS